MANKFTRTITTSKVTGYALRKIDGKMQMIEYGPVTVAGGKLTDSDARKALKRNGYEIPQNTVCEIEEMGTETYVMDLDTFLKYAKPYKETPLEQIL